MYLGNTRFGECIGNSKTSSFSANVPFDPILSPCPRSCIPGGMYAETYGIDSPGCPSLISLDAASNTSNRRPVM
jgi:hypothetical protein